MKNIIFDFGNVLVQWHPEHVYGEYFGDEAKAWWFLRHVADMDFRQRIDAGESFDGCIREKQAQYPEYEQAIELYRSKWREMLTDEVPGMREVIVELRGKNYELYEWSRRLGEARPEIVPGALGPLWVVRRRVHLHR